MDDGDAVGYFAPGFQVLLKARVVKHRLEILRNHAQEMGGDEILGCWLTLD